MVFKIGFIDFKEFVRIWGINSQSLIKVIREVKGNSYYLYLPLDHVCYCSIIPIEEFTPADNLFFSDKAIEGQYLHPLLKKKYRS